VHGVRVPVLHDAVADHEQPRCDWQVAWLVERLLQVLNVPLQFVFES
jgi:hypothetical protein